MNPSKENSITDVSAPAEFEATLRMIAKLSAPEGLEDRVQAGLRTAPAESSARVLAWPAARRVATAWMRSAAAAAIAAVIVGGSWGVYLRVQSIQSARAITLPPRHSTQGGFSSAGAMRTPQTLNGPMVEHPAVTPPATAAPLAVSKETTINPAKTTASKAIVPPAAAPEK